MSKLLVGISLLLLLGSAVLGFLNKGKLDKQISELENTEERAQTSQAEAASARTAEAEAKELASAEAAKREQAEADAAAAKTAVREAESRANDLDSKIAGLETQITELNERISQTPAAPVVDVAATAELEAQVRELESAVAAAEEEKKILMSKVEEERASAQVLRDAEERRLGAMMAKGLQGTILAFNPAWNFVVISIGDRQGVVANAEMVVMRGSTMVGRIRITSVEPSTSIADVLPTTVAAGMSIQPGDTVIYPGS